MYGHRSFSDVVVRALLVAALVVCAGCWEKIEYSGPRTPVTAPQATQPAAADSLPETEAVSSELPASPPSVVSTPVIVDAPAELAAKSLPPEIPDTPPVDSPSVAAKDAAPTPPAPKEEADRYATPPASESVASPPVVAAEQPAPVAAPATTPDPTDRYATATPASGSAPSTAAIDVPPAAAPPVAPAPKAIDSRQAAWLLGSQLSLAALAHDRGAAADKVPIWYANARAAAKSLGVSVGDLPEPAPAGDKSAASEKLVAYLITSYQTIGPQLLKQHGTEQIALFDVALQSNMLLLLYIPDGTEAKAIATPMAQTAPHMKLPAELWQPLLDLINKKAPKVEVQKAIQKMHADVERHLAERAEQGSR